MAVSPVGGFRGVPFYIRDFSDSGMNRSIIVHEFPNQTNPYLEDLGANTLSAVSQPLSAMIQIST